MLLLGLWADGACLNLCKHHQQGPGLLLSAEAPLEQLHKQSKSIKYPPSGLKSGEEAGYRLEGRWWQGHCSSHCF